MFESQSIYQKWNKYKVWALGRLQTFHVLEGFIQFPPFLLWSWPIHILNIIVVKSLRNTSILIQRGRYLEWEISYLQRYGYLTKAMENLDILEEKPVDRKLSWNLDWHLKMSLRTRHKKCKSGRCGHKTGHFKQFSLFS